MTGSRLKPGTWSVLILNNFVYLYRLTVNIDDLVWLGRDGSSYPFFMI
jgi:hypothetical protein